MNLIIDAGNSFIKWAVFKGNKIVKKETSGYLEFKKVLKAIEDHYPLVENTIVSAVGNLPSEHIKSLEQKYNLLILNHHLKLPFDNLYKTPQTLGVDRIALVSASVKRYPDKNCLIIDAGTCITFDFIDSENQYHGGAISPGIRLRYKSLHDLTANLPLLKTKSPKNITGTTTNEAIHSGVVFGVCNEIDGVIDNYKLKYPDLTVILTGGDTKFLSKKLKSTIFAHPNFLLEGLNFLLKHNLN